MDTAALPEAEPLKTELLVIERPLAELAACFATRPEPAEAAWARMVAFTSMVRLTVNASGFVTWSALFRIRERSPL